MSAASTSRPLKVLHLVHRFATGGGIQTYVANAIAAVDASRIASRVASVFPGDVPERLAQIEHRSAASGSSRIGAVWQFASRLGDEMRRADVVHIHGLFTWQFVCGALAALATRTPFIASPHGCLEPWFLEWRGSIRRHYVRSAAKALLPRAFTTLVTSSSEARTVRNVHPGIRLDTICPGIPMQADVPPTPHSAALRVLYLSQIEPKKGLPVLLRAVAMLRSSAAIRLDVVGSGTPEYEHEVRELARALGLQAEVAWRGFLTGTAKENALRQADVMVLPSFSENFGFVVAEAMAAGVPVVTTPEVASHEFVQRHGAGTIVPAGDVAALAAALERYRDPALRDAAGQAGRKGALSEFSLEVMGARLERLYVEAASARFRPDRPARD